jgi:hypothetical protein
MNFDPSGSSNRALVVHGNTGQCTPLAELGKSNLATLLSGITSFLWFLPHLKMGGALTSLAGYALDGDPEATL